MNPGIVYSMVLFSLISSLIFPMGTTGQKVLLTEMPVVNQEITCVSAFSESPEAIEKAAAESVLELIVFDFTNHRIAGGSAFVAFSDRLMITSNHVLKGMDHITVTSENGVSITLYPEDILYRDKDADTAIFQLPEDSGLNPLPVSDEIPLRGEKTVAIGSARGIMNLVSLGNISAHWSDGMVQWIVFSAPVSPGSSGGPLINDRGEVIGIIMGSYDDSQNLNFAVPIQEAKRMIEEGKDLFSYE